MTDKPTIAAWLADYRSDLLGRELQPAERMLAEEVLLNFLLDEQWLNHRSGSDAVRQAFDRVIALVDDDIARVVARIGTVALASIADVEGRLSRQEHANLIMREHLTMLSIPPAKQSGS